MSENDKISYPELKNEVIEVTNFLVIKSIKKSPMECGDITVLVGEQASGKSILAKLQYFFWKYQSDLFDEETLSNKTIAGYSKDKVDEFFELFSVTINPPTPFKIEYKSNDIEICLERVKTGHKPRITISPFLEKLYSRVRNSHKKYLKFDLGHYSMGRGAFEQISEKSDRKYEESRKKSIAHRALGLELDNFFTNVPDVLYVPAARSFFLTIEDNIFALLAKGTETLDALTLQFGEFLQPATRMHQKRNMHASERGGKLGATIIKEVLKGELIQENDKSIIRAPWGDVELRHASSGQKEALPLILSLLYFPADFRRRAFSVRIYPFSVKRKRNQLLIIEEPEAHIYPDSQRALIKMIAEVVRKKNCKVTIATHSPYIPACVNNEIIAAQNEGETLAVSAYHVSNGTARSIYYEKHDLIDVDKLDEVSDKIADEYFDLTEKQDSAKKGKGKSGD